MKSILVRLAVALAAIVVANPVGAARPASANNRPNIIWLMAEDVALDLECYGMKGVKTPNLNRLAREGMLFTRAYCANPICSPNRSSMMVGVNQTVINAQHHRSNRDVPLMAPYKPITYWLREAGYTCTLGHSLVMAKGQKIDCNFRHEPVGPYDGVEHFGLFDTTDDFSPEMQPFFSQIQLKVTHRGDWWNQVRRESKHPVSVDDIELPPWFADTPEIRYDWAAYLDTVEYMDNEVGLLMQRLKEQGLDRNTIVIFIGDNGRCNLRGKGYLHDTGLHIPMIVWGAGVPAGVVNEELICTTDISATILKLAGATMPDYLDGFPFLGVEHPRYRQYVRSARDIWDEIDECSRSIITKDFAYIRNLMPEVPWDAHQAYLDLNRPAVHVMRRLKREGRLSPNESIFFAERKPYEELYDLRNDPDQLRNLAGNPHYHDVLQQMRALEAEWVAQNHDYGLADLGRRQPEQGLGAEVARAGVKKNEPDLWARLEVGELMETQAWMAKYRKAKKSK